MAGDIKKPTFEPQHYTLMAVSNPEDERATEGKYWHGTYHLLGSREAERPITSMGIVVTPAVDLPANYLQPLGERFVPEEAKVSVLPLHVQKADGMLHMELRTPGQNQESYRRLRTTLWMIKHVLNHVEDFALYQGIAAAGYVPDEDQVPNRWFQIPGQNLAIYDPDPEKDDPDHVLWEREGQVDEAGAMPNQHAAKSPAPQQEIERPAIPKVDFNHIPLPPLS